ncbi:MAG: hypothetical protein BWY74_00945 [Firmicutes bacterium ADurb.Bin419]|nr:MAG: hypothetical protein BWY74_00945 [Firmicutes bacterium ADurb.Bin419]
MAVLSGKSVGVGIGGRFMNSNEDLAKKLVDDINAVKSNLDAKKVKFFRVDRLKNIVDRLNQYSDSCTECTDFLNTFETDMMNNLKPDDIQRSRTYLKNFNKIVSHLCKKHKLVTPSYYVGLYLSLGMSVGMTIGMSIGIAISSNTMSVGMSLGMSLGMSFGILIGSLMDADAKKKGIVI